MVRASRVECLYGESGYESLSDSLEHLVPSASESKEPVSEVDSRLCRVGIHKIVGVGLILIGGGGAGLSLALFNYASNLSSNEKNTALAVAGAIGLIAGVMIFPVGLMLTCEKLDESSNGEGKLSRDQPLSAV